MEKSTSLTFLYFKRSTDADFAKLIDITSYPDIFTAPEKLDISTLSSNQKKYTKGMVDLPDYEFGFIYDEDDYAVVKGLEDDNTVQYQLRFGENGEYGKWQWSGGIFSTPTGGDVGAAREGKLVCYPETDIMSVDTTTVFISPIGDRSVAAGENISVNVNVNPSDATISAVSGTTAKATVAVSGKRVTVTGVTSGTSVITITAEKAGYTSATETFTVAVPA